MEKSNRRRSEVKPNLESFKSLGPQSTLKRFSTMTKTNRFSPDKRLGTFSRA
jgi:hypothetical protein